MNRFTKAQAVSPLAPYFRHRRHLLALAAPFIAARPALAARLSETHVVAGFIDLAS